jgi:hypothetical protein
VNSPLQDSERSLCSLAGLKPGHYNCERRLVGDVRRSKLRHYKSQNDGQCMAYLEEAEGVVGMLLLALAK